MPTAVILAPLVLMLVVPEMPPIPFDPASVQHAGTRWETAWLVLRWMGIRAGSVSGGFA